MPEDLTLRIESNQPLGASYFQMSLSADGVLPPWKPGQFAMLSLGARQDPLLRRPFSIYNLHDEAARTRTVKILYKVLGRGTEILSRALPGARLACLLPLGRGFTPERNPGSRLVLVAGGVGVASLHPLAAAEMRAGGAPLLLYGCRTAAEIVGADPTRALGVETLLATDDGSAGARGFVSDLLESELRARGAERLTLCACGPTAMLRATAEVARRHGARCYVSLESSMACGFGVCVRCVVGVRRAAEGGVAYKRTCIEGPVMDAAEIVW